MSAARNALGRGLGALLPSASTDSHAEPVAPSRPAVEESGAGASLLEISVSLIDPNPDQPRRQFDPAKLESLAASIARSGVLQPVVVTRSGERYQLVVGERRWRAAQVAGLDKLPAVLADVAPTERLELAIVENVQRHDLNPMELAHAYRALADRGATQEEIGKRVSKDRSSVANHLRLLELSIDLQEDIESGRITMGHAKALLQISDPEQRRKLRNRVVSQRLSVREAERLGRDIAGSGPSGQPGKVRGSGDPHLRELAELFQRHFQARVRVSGTPAKGRVEIEYGSSEDLDRITRLVLEGY